MKALVFSKLHLAKNAKHNALLLKHGRVQGMIESELVDKDLWKKVGLAAEDRITLFVFDTVEDIYLAASLDFPLDSAQRIREAVSQLSQARELERIRAQWR